MDYRKIFQWHPFYECVYHEKKPYIDKKNNLKTLDYVSTSVIKKKIYNKK